jgi:hypothetical protein
LKGATSRLCGDKQTCPSGGNLYRSTGGTSYAIIRHVKITDYMSFEGVFGSSVHKYKNCSYKEERHRIIFVLWNNDAFHMSKQDCIFKDIDIEYIAEESQCESQKVANESMAERCNDVSEQEVKDEIKILKAILGDKDRNREHNDAKSRTKILEEKLKEIIATNNRGSAANE